MRCELGAEEANTKAEANASPQQLPNPHVPQHLLTRTLARTPPRRLLARTAPICLRTAPMPLLRAPGMMTDDPRPKTAKKQFARRAGFLQICF